MAKAVKKKKGHHSTHTTKKLKNPFAGILFCEKCGAIMKRYLPHPRESPIAWYRCQTRGCDCKMVKCEVVENSIRNAMEDWLENCMLQIESDHQPKQTLSQPHWKQSEGSSPSSRVSRKTSANTWKRVCTPSICSPREMQPCPRRSSSSKVPNRISSASRERANRRSKQPPRSSLPPSTSSTIMIPSQSLRRIVCGNW